MDEKRQQAAEAASLARMGSGILHGLRVAVKWLFGDALGFTSDGTPKVINVAWHNGEYMDELSDDERIFFRMGVFAHEILHQVFTNFKYSNKICNELSQAEAGIFMRFANTIEDPAIEYFAPTVMGGKLLKALRFSIMHIYRKSPGIEVSSMAFSQLINALINFGDMGIVKGEFTFPEAKEAFIKVAPLYNEAIVCPDGRKRLDIAKECMEMTRDLWEEYVKNEEEWQKLIEELLDFLKKHGMPQIENASDPGDGGGSKGKRRAATLEKMESPSKGSKGSDDDADDDADDESEDDEDNDSDGEGNESSSDGENSDSSSESDDSEGTPGGSGSDAEEDDDDGSVEENIEDEYIIDEEDARDIRKALENEDRRLESEAASDAKSAANCNVPDYVIESPYFEKGKSCKNVQVKNGSASLKEDYNRVKAQYSWEINTLAKSLEKMFQAEREQECRSTSGDYNIKRGTIGTSVRIFDKRKEPEKKSDAAVCLCIDLSGSMHGSKEREARKMAIVFAEALTKVGVKYHIMGFHADTHGQDAYHEHFVSWDGKGRETLVAMSASSNNFDGYSIRYAARLLAERPEANKILFVISDGLPACYTYRSYDIGNKDVILAVRESRKMGNTTFGISLGKDASPEVISSFYGKDFVACDDEKMLTATVCKKLEKMFKH